MDLEVLVITFNRADELRRTLEAVLASPFGAGRVTVLDNASTDATPEVCAELAARYPQLRVVRHPRNVGAAANYLRAVELAEAEYAWILADDDELDFSVADDVAEAVRAGQADLISVGAPGRDDWPAGTLTTARALSARFLHVFTFVPNTIYRSAAFTSEDLREGYHEAGHQYPHFPFLRRQIEADVTVYVSRGEVVRRGGLTRPGSELHWFVNWARCCETISEQPLRRIALYGNAGTRLRWFLNLAGAIALERLDRSPGSARRLTGELLLLLRREQRLLLILGALPALTVPGAVLRPAIRAGLAAAGVAPGVEREV
jgi:glycosyltransferase involved in cell wall biosynthesis